MCLAGVDGYFKVLNGAWSMALGYSAEELLARPYLDFVHPDDHAATVAEAQKIADGFPTIHFRNRYRCKDGTYRWLAWTATPALADGTIYATARDVSDEVFADELAAHHQRELAGRVRALLASGRLRTVFQPIVDIRRSRTVGFEALSRFDVSPERSPAAWFDDATAAGLGTLLELRAVGVAAAHADALPADAFLSVNASPATLLSEDFSLAIEELAAQRVVVEVTEHAAVEDYEPLRTAIDRLRGRGVRLAIDDAGAGFASLKHIVRLLPDFIKLDMFLIRDIDREPLKRSVVAAMAAFAADCHAELVAEGVETLAELQVISELGVQVAQGFYLGVPAAPPATAERLL
jgi:PAS domain S-box-containing protein